MEPRGITSKAEREAEVTRLLELVGMRSYQRDRFPHEFSGGQRQRIGIARALAAGPRLLVADEPVSALDVSIQAQVLNLLLKLQSELNLTMLFIAHDLTVVRHMSDRIAVMYLGKIVELAESQSLYIDPRHPYTRSLLAAIPIPDPDVVAPPVEANAGAGSQGESRGGCVYRSRCPFAQEICATEPPLREIAPGHASACHFAETLPEFSRV
jgi:oligopeptide/dipeptide ABC transporter ATP-binding protein